MDTDRASISPQVSSPFVASLLNLNDPRERFLAGWVTRVHINPPRLFKLIALKRAEQKADTKADRLIYELAHWQGRPRCYMVIIWNIDEISMRWQEFKTHAQAMERYRTLS